MDDPVLVATGRRSVPPEPADVNTRLRELVVRSARGDEAAFAQLDDATAARVHGLVRRVVRDPAQAEEVTQEAFFQMWRQAGRLDAERGSSALAWMTLAHRRAVDRVRACEAARRPDAEYHTFTSAVGPDVTAEAAAASWEARRLRAALGSLTPVQRQAVELAYLGGYTHTEVAGPLDIPVGSAKTRIRDGMIPLRDEMAVSR